MKAIVTKYHGPTNTRGARISASDMDGNRMSVPYEHQLSGAAVHAEAVAALCAKVGWTGAMIAGSIKGGYVWVWSLGSDSFVFSGGK